MNEVHRRAGVRAWLATLALALFAWAAPAAAQTAGGAQFDHLRTGYPLTGVHNAAPCEGCHVGGVFKGTPRNCDSCHVAGSRWSRGNTVKPLAHVATQQACDTCHSTVAFSGAKMNHAGVAPGGCATCHNGMQAPGKPAGHIVTTASCDTCHRTTAWSPVARFDHSSFTAATNCVTCHNGSTATGKPATHIPVGATNCIACHSTTAFTPNIFNHTQVSVANQCASCHTGTYPGADGKPAAHIPYQAVAAIASSNCDTCHKAGYTAWTPVALHTSVTVAAQCSNCHLAARPATAIHTGQTVCESCHKSTSSWTAGVGVDHSTFTAATNCASCHNGTAATGKPATHIPVGATNCIACHNTTAFTGNTFNHTQVSVANQCASCHTGTFPTADGKPAAHIPYQTVAAIASSNCDTCHKAGYTAWTPVTLHTSVTVVAQCSNCHLSVRPATAIHTGQTVCESCHKSTSSWTAGTSVDHSTFTTATNCTTCHNGTTATGKPATHIPVAATNCIACHNTTAFTANSFNHTQVVVANQCATCHTGTFPTADGKPATHIPYQTVAAIASSNCDTCHKAGYTAWTPVALHTSVTVVAQCSNCHLSVRPATVVHTGQTVCENCHKSTTSWTAGVGVDHSTFTTATNCTACHNGTTATGKPATHIPVGATNCIACHTVTAFSPNTFNHTQVPVTDCASCHSGAFAAQGALGKPAGHIQYATLPGLASANCDTCHKAGYASWAGGKLHPYTTITGQCKSCHSGTYVSQGALAKPANHIPEAQLLNGGAMECNTCHTSTSSWTSEHMNHNASQGSGAGWCKACHASGTNYLGNMERMALTHQRSNPVPTDCSMSGCHRPLGSHGAAYSSWDN